MTNPTDLTLDGDPVDKHQAHDLRQDIRIEIDRVVAFIGKIESSLRKTTSAEHTVWLNSQHERQVVELRRLGRMTHALDARFAL